MLNSRIRMAHVHRIELPSAPLRGRGRAVTILIGPMRVKIILAYFPPKPWRRETRRDGTAEPQTVLR